ncbi:hypothetical protein Mapa_013650 [Marchantia paleacea]|nr:hypothetical protein Mapa_013650 [Marchantia paleacea]
MTADTMKLEDELPVIDFAGIRGPESKNIREKIAKACEWGFFQVINHGIDASLMERVEEAYKEFFHLPVEEKQKYTTEGADYEGWCSAKLEPNPDEEENGFINRKTCEFMYHVVLSADPNHTRRVPKYPTALRPTVLEYMKQVKEAEENVLAAMSEALGLEAGSLRKCVAPADVSIRGNFYPLQTADNIVGSVPGHSDMSMITFLQADKVPGLEIKKDDRWVRVKPLPKAFIVNMGDCIEVLSNGRFRSVEHRAYGNDTQERVSLASFYVPSKAATIGPVEEILDELHPPRFRYANYGDLLKTFFKKGADGKGYVEALHIKT